MTSGEVYRPRLTDSQHNIALTLFHAMTKRPYMSLIEPQSDVINLPYIQRIRRDEDMLVIENKEGEFRLRVDRALEAITTGKLDSHDHQYMYVTYVNEDTEGNKNPYFFRFSVNDGAEAIKVSTESMVKEIHDLPIALNGLWQNVKNAGKTRDFPAFEKIVEYVQRLNQYRLTNEQRWHAYRLSIAGAVKKGRVVQTEEIRKANLTPLNKQEFLTTKQGLVYPDHNLTLDPNILASAILSAEWLDGQLSNLYSGPASKDDRVLIYYPVMISDIEAHIKIEASLVETIEMLKKSFNLLRLPHYAIPLSVSKYIERVGKLSDQDQENFHQGDIAPKLSKFLKT